MFQECLKAFGKERMDLAEQILQHPKTLQEFELRFEMFLDETIRLHCEQPDLLTLISF